MVFVTLVQLFALGFHLDWFREVKRQPVYAIVFLLTGAVSGPWKEPLPPLYPTFMRVKKKAPSLAKFCTAGMMSGDIIVYLWVKKRPFSLEGTVLC